MNMVVCLLLVLVAFCQRAPDEFAIDLSLPPRLRYWELAQAKRENILKFIDFLHTDHKYQIAFRTAKALGPFLKFWVGKEFYQQCEGIAKAVGRNVSELVVFNYMYELGAYNDFCTSIAVQNGPHDYFLARNLDYGFQEYLASNSVKLSYFLDSQLIFQTVGHAGLIGAHTGLRVDGYSVTLNQRIDKGLHRTLEEIFFERAETVPYLVQKTLCRAKTIDEAYRDLLNTRICAAVYFILNGAGRNILIERQRVGAKAIYERSPYIVQTNTDWELPDPDTRRDVAEAKMVSLKMSHNITRSSVWQILTAAPNMNRLTLITVLLDTSQNLINATVWA